VIGRPARGTLLLCLLCALVSCSSSATPVSHHHRHRAVGSPTRPAATGNSERPSRLSVRVLPWRLPEPVAREAAVATSRGLVVAGGLAAGDQSTATAYRLDLTSGHAATLADLPVPVHDVGGATAKGEPEVVGGGNATEQDVVQKARRRGGWRISGHLPSVRSDLVAVTVGARVFAIGGYDGVTPALPDVLVSTRGGVFHAFARLRLAVRYAAVARSDGALWVFGGERNGVEVSAIQRIDLGTGRVQVAGHLPRPLGHASAVRLGSRVLLAGGRTSGTRLTAAMWWFDPAAPDAMHRAGSLPSPLADSAVVATSGAAYLVGGETPTLSDRVLRLTLS
jgi:hypothetical protein